ncbi:hypothetical protein [Streptomyces sp. NPDC056387]
MAVDTAGTGTDDKAGVAEGTTTVANAEGAGDATAVCKGIMTTS